MRRVTATAFFLTCFLTACTRPPQPDRVDNICSIFRQYHHWYWAAQKSEKRWRTPIPVMMAIVHQESRFNAHAKPPRTKLLWIIPWKRPSSAYGYSQALKPTWKRYKKEAGGWMSSRNAFDDAIDFVGWYTARARKEAGIARYDARSAYLAYHEGIGGFRRKTYRKKKWLMRVAQKVERQSETYRLQLDRCESRLRKKPWWKLW